MDARPRHAKTLLKLVKFRFGALVEGESFLADSHITLFINCLPSDDSV